MSTDTLRIEIEQALARGESVERIAADLQTSKAKVLHIKRYLDLVNVEPEGSDRLLRALRRVIRDV